MTTQPTVAELTEAECCAKLSGMFRDADGGGVHGLNERFPVRSLYEGQTFLYRVVRLYAGGQ